MVKQIGRSDGLLVKDRMLLCQYLFVAGATCLSLPLPCFFSMVKGAGERGEFFNPAAKGI